MNIIHFSTNDTGGAAIGTRCISNALASQGHNSIMIVKEQYDEQSDVIKIKRNSTLDLINKITKPILQRTKYRPVKWDERGFYHQLTFVSNTFKEVIDTIPFEPDLIVLHWVQGFLNEHLIKQLYQHYKVPVIWTLQDFAPMTGGCHYTWDCTNFKDGCGNCEAINSHKKKDISYQKIKHKQKQFKDINMGIMTLSTNSRKLTEESTLFKGLLHENFLYTTEILDLPSKEELRDTFQIPKDKFVVLFGAQAANNPNKGIQPFIEELNRLYKDVAEEQKEKLLFLIIGFNGEKIQKKLKFSSQVAGFISDKKTLLSHFALADVFASPSLQETGPQTVIESISYGVPVVGFDNVGLSNDVIEHKVSGYLAEEANFQDLCKGILYLSELDQTTYQKYCEKNIEIRNNKLSNKLITEQFIKLYQKLKA